MRKARQSVRFWSSTLHRMQGQSPPEEVGQCRSMYLPIITFHVFDTSGIQKPTCLKISKAASFGPLGDWAHPLKL